MNNTNSPKISFIIDGSNFNYLVTPFVFKNARATYQTLMDKVFSKKIGDKIEIYVDDMFIKTQGVEYEFEDLKIIFDQVRRYNMWLNIVK